MQENGAVRIVQMIAPRRQHIEIGDSVTDRGEAGAQRTKEDKAQRKTVAELSHQEA